MKKRLSSLAALMLFAVMILAVPAWAQRARIEAATGKIIFLRAHELGSGFGPPADHIDVEVVVQLDTRPGESYGFQLRNDARLPARRAMFDLLRDAFRNGDQVRIDYSINREFGRKNGILIRAALVK